MTLRSIVAAVACGAGFVAGAPVADAGIHGALTDGDSGEPLTGATVVATVEVDPASSAAARADGSSDDSQWAAITDDLGGYAIDVPSGTYQLTIYYDDVELVRSGIVVVDDQMVDVSLPVTVPAYHDDTYDTYFIYPTSRSYVVPLYAGRPSTIAMVEATDQRLVRQRDDHGLARLDARVGGATVATVDGGVRLPGSPGIASEFVSSIATAIAGAPIEFASASGGSEDVAIITGSNRPAGAARLGLGPDARLSAIVGGPLVNDHWWTSTGIMLERTAPPLAGATSRFGAQAIASTNIAVTRDLQFAAVGLSTWRANGGRDAWADSRLVWRDDDHQRDLTIGITEQRTSWTDSIARRAVDGILAPTSVHRLAGRLSIGQHGRWHGHHGFMIGGEVGGGTVDDATHSDVRGFVGDEWTPKPNWTIRAGVRWDDRSLGTARIARWQPRIAVTWDPSEQGTTSVFATAERGARLDEVEFGNWRHGTTTFDQAGAGITKDWDDRIRWTAAVRARASSIATGTTPESGVELAAEWLGGHHVTGQATLSTLEHAATVRAGVDCGCQHYRFGVDAIARVTPEARTWGAALAVQQQPKDHDRSMVLHLGVELFDLDDTTTRSGQAVLGARF
jgi:TonB dependent receptor